jgi:hypothetical protein
MRKTLAFVSFVLTTSMLDVAHADLVPDGEKSVKLAIRVDGDVPVGQTIVLGHTFRGIDVIKPGPTAAPVEWHPLGGQMQLAAVPSSAVMANVEQLRQDLKRNELDAVFKQGKPCHAEFQGIRTVPRSAPADTVQWNYRVAFSGDKCTATLVSMQFFDKSGAEVAATDIPHLPANVFVGPPEKAPAAPANPAPAAEPAKTSPPTTSSEPSQVPKGACGCRIGPGAAELEMATVVEKWGPFASFALFALALGFRRNGRSDKR